MLEIAKEKNRTLENVEYLHTSLESLTQSIPAITADTIIVLGDVLSYVDDATKAMDILSQISKSGTVLIGSVDGYYRGLKEIIFAGAFDAIKTLERFRKIQVGNPDLTEESLISRVFKPSDLTELLESKGFVLEKIAGIEVFGPYEDRHLSRYMNEILEVELKYSRDPNILGMAEHLFFFARRRW